MISTYSLRLEKFMEQIPKSGFLSHRDNMSFSRMESLEGRYGRNPMQLDFETKSFQEKSLEFFRQEFELARKKRLYVLDGLITNSQNSKFANLVPQAKFAQWKEIFQNQSLKLQWMAKLTETIGWPEEVITEHEREVSTYLLEFLTVQTD